MRDFIRPLLLMGFVLAVPIIPFAFFGSQIESAIRTWSEQPGSQWKVAAITVGLLATDIVLPVPSSLISTIGGWKLGWLFGTGASWIGMNIGAVLGFAASRRWGRRLANRLSKPDQLERYAILVTKFGPYAVLFCRGVPVLAEASVLWMGIHQLTWRRFLAPVLISNLVLAFVYSTFGEFAAANEWVPLAIGVSIAIPVLLMACLNNVLKGHPQQPNHATVDKLQNSGASPKVESPRQESHETP